MTMNNSQIPPSAYQSANPSASSAPYPVGRPIRLQAVRLSRTLEGHTDVVTSVAFSASGHLALSGSWDDTIKLWDLANGRCLRTLKVDAHEITSVALSDDGHWALVVSVRKEYNGSHDRVLEIWDLANGCCLHTLYLEHVSWGKLSASVSETIGRDDHQMLTKLSLGNPSALSADGCWALHGLYDGTLKLWDIANRRYRRILEEHTDRATSLALTIDGRRALSGSSDETVKIWRAGMPMWDLAHGFCLYTLEGHTGGVSCVALSDSAHLALSGSWNRDGTLNVWDLTNGSQHTLSGHMGAVESVALSANSRWALSGSWDNTVKLWALDWELEIVDDADWDEGARPYLVNFLTRHTPFAGKLPRDRRPTEEEVRLALTRRGKPTLREDAFQGLIRQLQHVGYGWLRPEGVRSQLTQMAETWTEPPPLFAADHAKVQSKQDAKTPIPKAKTSHKAAKAQKKKAKEKRKGKAQRKGTKKKG